VLVLPFFAAAFFEVERVEDSATVLDDRFAADFAEVEADFDAGRFAFTAMAAAFFPPDFELLRFALAPTGAGLARCIF
jgi:hypothetical protein